MPPRLLLLIALPTLAFAAQGKEDWAAIRKQLEARAAAKEGESEISAEIRQADQREMVRPPPPGFRPEPADKKVRVILIPMREKIRVGEHFWYRLELMNVGRKPVRFAESPSFLKDGLRWNGMKWQFDAVYPNGQKKKLILGRTAFDRHVGDRPRHEIKLPVTSTATAAAVQRAARLAAFRLRASRDLDVTLAPGESVRSKPWRWVSDEEYMDRYNRGLDPWPAPEGPYRELWTAAKFDRPGKFKITATLRDLPLEKPTEERLRDDEKRGLTRGSALSVYESSVAEALGWVESNIVELDVIP